MRNNLLWFSVLVTLAATPAMAITPDETDAAKIMSAVQNRKTGDKVKTRMVMLVKDDAGRERKRVVQSRSLEFAGGTKQLIVFEAPAEVRNRGVLSVDYDAGDKDDDQWLYLPSLKKSTRISSSDKSGSFMGTDLSYSDMTSQDPSEYTYKIIAQSVQIDGDDCWQIEARPKTERTKTETGYVKSHTWVSKTKMSPLKVKSWIREGKKIKIIKFRKWKQIDGIWTVGRIIASTRQGKAALSKTLIVFKEQSFNNADVKPGDFTQRRLEKGL